MNDDRKAASDKGYAYVPSESISSYAESIGLSDDQISEAAVAVLAEDVSYRVRELIQNSKQFAKHEKETTLKSEHINYALISSDNDEIHGQHYQYVNHYVEGEMYGYRQVPRSFTFLKEANIYVQDEKEVDLGEYATISPPREMFIQPKIKVEWVAMERNAGDQNDFKSKKNGDIDLSEDFSSYYEMITKIILGSNEELLAVAWNDLKSNKKLAPVMPFLVNFIGIGVKKLSRDLTQLMKMLHTIQALSVNESVFLAIRPYLDVLVTSLLHCILEFHSSPKNSSTIDHWSLREYGARILAEIIHKYSTPVNQLKTLVENLLQEWIIDTNVPLCSYYGAIMIFIFLGPASIEYGILPHLKLLWNNLNKLKAAKAVHTEFLKSDISKVIGILTNAAEMLMLHKSVEIILRNSDSVSNEPNNFNQTAVAIKIDRDPEFNFPFPGKNTSSSGVQNNIQKTKMRKLLFRKQRSDTKIDMLYQELSELFGDALATRLPQISTNVYLPKKEKIMCLFSFPNLASCGEELLNSLNEKEDECRSNASLDEEHSYDDNSVLSDDQEESELRIKNTVSDPNLGIKLILTKLPKNKASSSPDSPKNSKRRKTSHKIPKDTPENSDDDSTLLRPIVKTANRPVNILFEGSFPVPTNKLRHRKIGTEFFYNQVNTKKTPMVKCWGKMKLKASKDQIFKSRFQSGFLNSFL